MAEISGTNRLLLREPGLAAGGTLPREQRYAVPSLLRRLLLLIEMLGLFIGLPLALEYAVHNESVPLFVVLQPVLLAFIVFLLWDRTFYLRRELIRLPRAKELISMLAIFAIAGGMVAAYVAQEMPARYLNFPLQRPQTWERIMILYPMLSVPVQELVYRTFFFHRYGPLFGEERGALILANGILFGFAHFLFGNWIAIAGTAVIGTLLAYRYEATRSFWAVWLEHTLWGWLVFTVGLGHYFFTGVSNFSMIKWTF